jgi:hypothetical protein
MQTSDVRDRVTSSARAMAAMDAGPGTYQRYLELIAPGESPEAQLEMAAMHSPGLLVAAIWRAVGVRSERLDPPYVLGTSVSRLVDLAGDVGAWVPFADGQIPGPGDVVILRAERRRAAEAYVVTAIAAEDDGVRVDSVEAAVPGDGHGAIVERQRTWKGRHDVVHEARHGERSGHERVIEGWIDADRLPVAEAGLSFALDEGPADFAEGAPERLPPDITKVTAGEMIAALGEGWQGLFGETPKQESVFVLVAQWALETGWGKGMHAYNVGNIKSVEGDGEDFTYFTCDEYIGGKHVWFSPDSPACRFRAYKTLALGALDYLKTVSQRYAASWTAVIAGDPAQYAHMLKMQKYYTGSEADYTSTLVSVVHQLQRTASAAAPAPAAAPAAEPAAPAQAGGAGPNLATTLGVQQALQTLGFDVGTPDGVDGPHTRAAVQAFQKSAGLTADGLVGPATRGAFAAALAKLTTPAAPAASDGTETAQA